MDGSLTLGGLVAFQSYVLAMWAPVRWIGFINQMGAQAIAAGERVFQILDTPLSVTERPGAVALPRLAGRVDSRGSASPTARSTRPAHRITATVEPDQVVALLGHTGAGKTSLVASSPASTTSPGARADRRPGRARRRPSQSLRCRSGS